MIMDNLLLLDGSMSSTGVFTPTSVSSGSTFTVGSQASANVIDLSQIASSAKGYGRDIGIGNELWIVCCVTTSFTGTSSTMSVNVQYAPDSSGSIGSWVTVVSTVAYTLAQLTLPSSGIPLEILRIPVPPVSPQPYAFMPKYMQLTYTVGTNNMTAGALYSAIVIDRQALGPYQGYQSGYSNTYI